VGRLAGLPASVINRAKQVLEQIAKNSHIATGLRSGGNTKGDLMAKSSSRPSKETRNEAQMTIFDTNSP
jgi:DNA mismatch repair protein MutS